MGLRCKINKYTIVIIILIIILGKHWYFYINVYFKDLCTHMSDLTTSETPFMTF